MTRRKLFGVLPIPLLFGLAGPAPEEPDWTIGIETDAQIKYHKADAVAHFRYLAQQKDTQPYVLRLYQAGKLKQMVRVGKTGN